MQNISDHIPGWPVAVAGSTSWAWLPSLAGVNDVLTIVLTGAGIILTGLKIYEWFRKRNDQEHDH